MRPSSQQQGIRTFSLLDPFSKTCEVSGNTSASLKHLVLIQDAALLCNEGIFVKVSIL